MAARGRGVSAVHTVHVDGMAAGAAPYTITIGADLLDDGACLAAGIRGRHVLLASDSNVAPLHAARVEASLRAARPALEIARFVRPAGEQE